MEDIMTAKKDSQIATFQIGEEMFGIGIHNIKEIVRYPKITSVPRAPDYLQGLTNLRGNILPVIDARIRLGLPLCELTDRTRVLVLDTGVTTTGVVVDNVKGVISMENVSIEAPPPILSSGVDTRYIESVIKANKGEKIIMELDVESLCAIDIKTGKTEDLLNRLSSSETVETKAGIKEIQLVTFLVAGEEYGFPIEAVREVLRVGRITGVPEAPPYVIGVFSIRNSLLPIINIRTLFNIPSLIEEIISELDDIKLSHEQWLGNLKESVDTGSMFTGETDYTKGEPGRWFEGFRTSSEGIGKEIQEIRMIYQKIYESAAVVVDIVKSKSKQEGLTYYENNVFSKSNHLFAKLEQLKGAIKKDIKEDQRILVVEVGKVPVGILVDRMQQVIRIPENIIDSPPSILSTEKSKSLRGIAKLDEGKRLFLLLDEDKLFSEDKIRGFDNMGSDLSGKKDGQVKMGQTEDDEIQLVTFKLGKEEFAIKIEDVQEINRLDNITSVPRAPSFVEGVMNLRGNVIPAIDLRKRFDMELVKHDDTTKVIIVNIKGKLTGFIVDSVSEVLRLPTRSIEAPPDVVNSNVQTEFISGIGKIDKDNRMIILIDVNRILTLDEQALLYSASDRKQNGMTLEQDTDGKSEK
jgi:purine-binding chemotaxis protein CheW